MKDYSQWQIRDLNTDKKCARPLWYHRPYNYVKKKKNKIENKILIKNLKRDYNYENLKKKIYEDDHSFG